MMPVIEKEFDVVVVGSGGSGAAAASAAARSGARVLVISKDPLVCSDSKIAEGIVTVRESGSVRDSEHNLVTNMAVEGGDIGDRSLLAAFASDSRDAYGWLEHWGLRASRNRDTGKPVSFALGGHNLPRSVPHPQGGLDYGHSLWNAMLQSDNPITCIEDAWCLEVVTEATAGGGSASGRVLGCLAYHAASGSLWNVRAPTVILACGGLSTLYFPNTDTMRGNTGDGYAIAARLGCELVDMEQVQFIPFGLVAPKSYEGLLVGEPASAGPLGVLRDREGKLLLTGIMRRTRAEVSAVIALAVAEGRGTERGGCYLDLTHNVAGKAGAMYYEIFSTVGHAFIKVMKGAHGPKAAEMKEMWEVRPTAHYCMGGVRVNAHGESVGEGAIHGLLAAGQVMGGLHGGNRLGSTSLAEAVIFGLRAGLRAAALAQHRPAEAAAWQRESQALLTAYQPLIGRAGTCSASQLTHRLQQVAWECLGPVRTREGIRRGLSEISSIREQLTQVSISEKSPWNQSLIDYLELRNLITTAEMIGRSALERDASLGAHVLRNSVPRDRLNRHPYSVIARYRHDGWQVQRLPRDPTPLPAYLGHKLGKATVLAGMALLRHVPQRNLERILGKMYRKRAVEMGVHLTADAPQAPEDGGTIRLRLHERIVQTATSVSFRFHAETDDLPEFLPGQFGNFIFDINGKTIQRSYSFSSSPTDRQALEITVKREPGGLVSNWLIDELHCGQSIGLKGVRGKFCLPPTGGPRKLLLVGAGSGITPLVSMLRWIADSQQDLDVILINSVRTPADIIFASELATLPRRHPGIRVYHAFTGAGDTAESVDTARGRLDQTMLSRWVPDLAQRHVFTCGPAAFMGSVQALTRALGVPKRKLHLENFATQLDLTAFAGKESYAIEFARSALSVPSVPGKSLLDLADSHNLDTNFSCRSGTCGECKTRLLDGRVHMVCEDGLSAGEKLDGYILTCTAVPLSDCQLDA